MISTDQRPLYVDIDGTLTDNGNGGGNIIQSRIDYIIRLIKEGHHVIIWSGNGTKYAKDFVAKHNIDCLAIGKPETCVDDNPDIRPRDKMKIFTPEDFFSDNQ